MILQETSGQDLSEVRQTTGSYAAPLGSSEDFPEREVNSRLTSISTSRDQDTRVRDYQNDGWL